MKKWMALPVAITAFSFSGFCLAGADTGLYVGGSVGQASVDSGDVNLSIDDDSSGYKVFLGYNFGIIPLLDLAVEGGYRDFGDFSNSLTLSKINVESWDLFGLAALKLGPFGFFGKVGYANLDSDVQVPGLPSSSDSDSNPAYGIGARFQIGSFAIRGEYEVFDLDVIDDLTMLSVGAAYTF